MRSHASRILSACALVATLLLSGASMADATRGQPDHPVPLRAAIDGNDYIVVPPPAHCPTGTSWEYHFEGIGQMSHLGRVDIEVVHCTTMDFASGTGFFGPGTITVTAKNGDALVMADTGTFTFDGIDSVIDLDWSVLGGTGRFLGATGEGDGALFGNVPTASLTGDLWGELIYDASNRANR
jgi:hypothetical protein